MYTNAFAKTRTPDNWNYDSEPKGGMFCRKKAQPWRETMIMLHIEWTFDQLRKGSKEWMLEGWGRLVCFGLGMSEGLWEEEESTAVWAGDDRKNLPKKGLWARMKLYLVSGWVGNFWSVWFEQEENRTASWEDHNSLYFLKKIRHTVENRFAQSYNTESSTNQEIDVQECRGLDVQAASSAERRFPGSLNPQGQSFFPGILAEPGLLHLIHQWPCLMGISIT